MNQSDNNSPHIDAHDVNIDRHPSSNSHIGDILQVRLSRRKALGGSFAATAAMLFGGVSLAGCSEDDDAATPSNGTTGGLTAPTALGFTSVAHSLEDVVKLPTGYSFSVLLALGDPLKSGVPDWADDGSETGDSYADRAGDHHDAMNYFGLRADGKWDFKASSRGLLCINHEAITQNYLHGEAVSLAEPRNEDQVVK